MAAISDLSDLINIMTGGGAGTPENMFFYKSARVAGAAGPATVAGRWTSLWTFDGSPSGGVAPTIVANPDNTTAGSLKQINPGSGRQKWLLGATASPLVPGTLLLYDRLLHIGGLSGTITTAQTVGGSLTRYTNASSKGNEIWVEIYTAIGATSSTITASYTNQAGTSGQTTQAQAIGGTGLSEQGRIIPLALASGDSGVRAVASVTLTSSTGTAGNFGVTIARPLLEIPLSTVGVGAVYDLISGLPGITEILPDACLAWAWLANSTTTPEIFGSIHFAEK